MPGPVNKGYFSTPSLPLPHPSVLCFVIRGAGPLQTTFSLWSWLLLKLFPSSHARMQERDCEAGGGGSPCSFLTTFCSCEWHPGNASLRSEMSINHFMLSSSTSSFPGPPLNPVCSIFNACRSGLLTAPRRPQLECTAALLKNLVLSSAQLFLQTSKL